MLVFYDFEVFEYDWLVVSINPVDNNRTIIVNDKNKLERFYKQHRDDIWIGFNNRGYDQHILRAILSGFNPYEVSQWIVEKDKNGYSFNRNMNNIKLLNYDVSGGQTDYGLKTLEAFMGDNIKETTVPFNIGRKLTYDEIKEVIEYCIHDVEETIKVFIERKDEFNTQLGMINEFTLPIDNLGKTVPQLLSVILGAESSSERKDDYNIRVPDTLRINKYTDVVDWFLNAEKAALLELNAEYELAREYLSTGLGSRKSIKTMEKVIHDYKNKFIESMSKYFYSRSYTREIAGVEHQFAWGGVHGAIPKYNYVCKDDELLIMADVTSLYPTLMIQYDLQSRGIKDKSIFLNIYNTNVEMKKSGDKRRPIYKLACNMTFGAMGDRYNNLYDKLHQNLVCVFGQLLLLDLIEKLEPHITLIQSNTDGILFKIKRKDFEIIDDIIYEWEQRTRLQMEFTYAKKIYQKDVNNYVMVTTDGKVKSKGAYVKKLSRLDNDLPIVNKALIDYMVKDIPIEYTINSCKDLIMFQKIIKLSGKYDYVVHNRNKYTWKCYRVFASKDLYDGTIYKCKNDGKQDRFANTPEYCFIYNDTVNGVEIPKKLDRNYYIGLAKERLDQFGVL